ncbi:hypothetical protein PHAVU_001G119600 [Phaseolus vulgaris]
MPSSSNSKQKKKQSKAQLQNSPLSSNTTTTPSRTQPQQPQEHASLCVEASRKFPSLIAESAFVAEIIHVDDIVPLFKGFRIWLSEPSMLSSSLSPGSIVSVSIPSSDEKNSQLHSFPLVSLANECAKCNGLEVGKAVDDDVAGNYFVLATVFPASKVLKNGVRLSSNLYYTMGCPPMGTSVFVCALQKQLLPTPASESNEHHYMENNRLPINNCKELYLQLVPSKKGLPLKFNSFPSLDVSKVKSHVQFENDTVASPATPSYGSKFSNASGLSSPQFDDSASSVPNHKGQSLISSDVSLALRDENSKQSLETWATSWLYSRSLLLGNLVSVPMFSECFFQVLGAKKQSVTKSDQYPSNGSSDLYPEDSDIADSVNQAFTVNYETKVFLSLPSNTASEEPIQRDIHCVKLDHKVGNASLPDRISKLGGLSKEYTLLKDIISSSLNDALSSFGLRTTRGVLLHGPTGTGKTSLAQLCTHDVGVNFFPINGPEIVTQYYGESEQALHKVFDSAIEAAPAVVFIDELDAIAPARKEGGEELSQRLVATLLNMMDGISRTEGLLVIAATNRPDHIEPALRRPGRFDKEIEIGVPSPKQRSDILLTLLNEMDHCLSEVQVQHLATVTHGFVGADLAALCNEAALNCLRHYASFKKTYDSFSNYITDKPVLMNGVTNSIDHLDEATSSVSDMSATSPVLRPCRIRTTYETTEIIPESVEEEQILKVSFEDFQKARMKIRPSAMREVILEVPKVNWEDVGGQREVKAQLMEAVEWPQKHHDAFDRIGTRPPTGVLMFGPPGCSKTLMARAVASEAGLNFLAVKGPELFSKWVGESEKAVRSLFAKARANAPSIVFFDEIDSLAVTRGKESDGVSVSDRVMSQLLVEMDGLHQRVNVTVIAATNRPDKIDPALLRPGRFDRLLYVGPPNEVDREEIFRIHLRKIPCGSDVSLRELALLTDGCTGADISLICREAAVATIEL